MASPREKDPQSPKSKQGAESKKTAPLTDHEHSLVDFVANSMAIEGMGCDRVRLIREGRQQGLIGSCPDPLDNQGIG